MSQKKARRGVGARRGRKKPKTVAERPRLTGEGSEGALQEAHDSFEAKVKERTAELSISNAQLRFETEEGRKTEQKLAHLNALLSAIRDVNQLIAREKQRDKLLKGACDKLVEKLGYYNVWISLFDESGRFISAFESGVGNDFLPLVELFKRGELPNCAMKALGQSGVSVIEDPQVACSDCPLAKKYEGRGALSARLEHGGSVYGLITGRTTTSSVQSKEEQSLFEELAGDIGFALHNIKLEKDRERAEEQILLAKNEWERTFDSMPDLVAIIDKEHRIVRVNKSMAQRLGTSPDQCVGLNCFKCVHKLDGPLSFCPHSLTLADGKEHVAEVHEPNLKGDFIVSTTPLFDGSGKVFASVHVARDITERKKAEEALKQSERQFKSLAVNAPDVIMRFDTNLRILYLNPQVERATGIPSEQWIGKTNQEMGMPPQLVELWNDMFHNAASSKQLQQTEFNFPSPEGTRTFSLRVVPEFAEDGSLTSFLGISHDITDMRKAEIELRKARDELEMRVEERTKELRDAGERLQAASLYARSLIEASLDPLVTINAEGKITDVNKATEEVTGCPREQLVGSDFSDYFTDPEEARKGYRQVFAEGFVRDYPLAIRHKSGNVTDVLYNATVFKNEAGETQGVFAAARDITELKRAEEALRKAHDELELRVEERTRELTEATWKLQGEIAERKQVAQALRESEIDLNRAQTVARTGSWRLDVQKDELLWSDETYRTFGIPEGTPMTYESFLAAVHSDDRELVDQKWKAALRNEPYDIEHRIVVNGETKWVREKAELEFDANGTLVAGFGTVQDVTERKQMQDKLEEYAKHLEELVQEKTNQLKNAERLAAIGQTAGMVGHDIRNPLQSIEGAVYLAKEELRSLPIGTQPKQELDETLGIIESQTRYIDHIVADLQDFAGTPIPKPTETSVEELIAEALSVIEIPENIEVTTVVQDDLQKIVVDPTYMKRVLINLIENAVQAMRNGGKLTVNARSEPEAVCITVEDTGVGISEENKSKMFTPLFTTKSKGQGFGLPVCKKLIEAHNGQITFESEAGRGTIFRIKLPKKAN